MPDTDDLLEAAEAHRPQIVMLYRQFSNLKPIMLLDIQEQRIYAYPYAEYLKELSERSRCSLKSQYEKALQEHQMVIFVRDNEQRRLVSFSVDEE